MILNELFNTIKGRRTADPEKSYTARLFHQGEDEILKKIGEESVEVILAAKGQGDARLVEEIADLSYHILVLLAERGLSLEEVNSELERRSKK